MFGFVQMMFTEEYYVCCVWFGFLGVEGVGLYGEFLCAFELLAFIIVLYLFIEGVGLYGEVLCAFELLAFIFVLYLFFYLGGCE